MCRQDSSNIKNIKSNNFVRIKHFSGFPNKSIDYCLKEGGIKISDLDADEVGI